MTFAVRESFPVKRKTVRLKLQGNAWKTRDSIIEVEQNFKFSYK